MLVCATGASFRLNAHTAWLMMIQNGTTICINNSLRYFADNLKLLQPDAVFLVPLFIERLEYMIWKDARKKNREEELRALIAKSNDEMKRGIDNRDEIFEGYQRIVWRKPEASALRGSASLGKTDALRSERWNYACGRLWDHGMSFGVCKRKLLLPDGSAGVILSMLRSEDCGPTEMEKANLGVR